MENITGCTTDCDPCLRDASGCCSWSPEKEGGSREGKAVLEKTECAFCEGGIPKLDMIVPKTGGNTCGSIQLLAFKDYNGTDTCEILRKQENVCCPEQSIHLALETLSDNAIVIAENIEGEGGGVMSGQEIVKHFASGGRLGNQLFEHAATLAIAKTTGKQACVIGNNVGLIDRYFTDGVFLRNCSNIAPSESVSETGYGIFSPLPKTEGSLEIRGYFQSWKYFAGAEAEIIQAFKLKPKYARDADEIISKGGSNTHCYNVGIHMRWFDDYLREPPKEYYQKAMQYFRHKYGTESKRVRFYLASTDIERSKNLQIFSDESVVFLNGQHAISDFAVLMSCDGMILSSGTFGWWAAWLGAHQREGDVLYFGEVFRMSHRKNKGLVNKEDFYPPTWREISAREPSLTNSTRPGTELDPSLRYYGKHASMNSPSPPATIVTAYFNIDSKHPHDDYIRWMKNMLSLKDPMVIFTSPDMVPTFHSLRSHASNSTKIITMELNETLMSRTYDVQFWQDQYAKDPERKAHRSYFIYWIWNEKLEFLRRTIEENPFHSDFFAWVDIGSFRVSNLNDQVMLKQIPAGLKQNQVLGLDVSGFRRTITWQVISLVDIELVFCGFVQFFITFLRQTKPHLSAKSRTTLKKLVKKTRKYVCSSSQTRITVILGFIWRRI
mmetsp:Transcript_23561/g.38386  ORF Transcript_23561/g.38386 Transcript_23561/m.38386 type:complete len:665 (-) Transcript_23561:97-2091(-)